LKKYQEERVQTQQEIFTKVQEIIIHQLDTTPDAITERASFVDDLGADSLAVVEMVLAIEEQFDVSIPDEDAESLRTVGDAVSYIARHLQAHGIEAR
jgi:acyl carrier protein